MARYYPLPPPFRRSCAFMIPESSGGLSTTSRSEERRIPLSLFSMTTTVLLLRMSLALCERWTFAPVNNDNLSRVTRWARACMQSCRASGQPLLTFSLPCRKSVRRIQRQCRLDPLLGGSSHVALSCRRRAGSVRPASKCLRHWHCPASCTLLLPVGPQLALHNLHFQLCPCLQHHNEEHPFQNLRQAAPQCCPIYRRSL